MFQMHFPRVVQVGLTVNEFLILSSDIRLKRQDKGVGQIFSDLYFVSNCSFFLLKLSRCWKPSSKNIFAGPDSARKKRDSRNRSRGSICVLLSTFHI